MQENGVTEDEIVGWCHQLKGQEFEQIPEDGEGQGSLAYCSPWLGKESVFASCGQNIGTSASKSILPMNI